MENTFIYIQHLFFLIRKLVISKFSLYQDSGLPSSLVPVKVQQEEARDPDLRQRDSPPSVAEEGHEDDEDSSYQISEALNHHFYYSNGILRPRPHSNGILLHPRGQII